MSRTLAIVTFLIFPLIAFGDSVSASEADLAALEAKGLKFKKARDGAVIEAYVGPEATLSPAEYKVIGEFRDTLVALTLNASEPRLTGEILAAIGPMPKVERFFSNGARLLDDDFRHFAGWTSLKRSQATAANCFHSCAR